MMKPLITINLTKIRNAFRRPKKSKKPRALLIKMSDSEILNKFKHTSIIRITMIKKVVFSEKELRSLLIKDLRSAAKEKGFPVTAQELKEQVDAYFADSAPEEYPIYVFTDFTFICKGFNVDLLSTTHYIRKSQMLSLIADFQKIPEENAIEQ